MRMDLSGGNEEGLKRFLSVFPPMCEWLKKVKITKNFIERSLSLIKMHLKQLAFILNLECLYNHSALLRSLKVIEVYK